jgi:hypothetical protein
MNTRTAKKILAVLAISVMLLAGAVTAGTKESWRFHDIVEADFVIAHLSIPMTDNVMIIDARPYKPMYIKGHIPGAVSIPDTDFDKKTDLLPADKNALLIFYCGGLECKLRPKSRSLRLQKRQGVCQRISRMDGPARRVSFSVC